MKESLGPQYCHGPEGGGPALITSHDSSPVSRSLPPPQPILPSPSSPQPRGHFPLETCSWEKGLASALSCQMVHGNREGIGASTLPHHGPFPEGA